MVSLVLSGKGLQEDVERWNGKVDGSLRSRRRVHFCTCACSHAGFIPTNIVFDLIMCSGYNGVGCVQRGVGSEVKGI